MRARPPSGVGRTDTGTVLGYPVAPDGPVSSPRVKIVWPGSCQGPGGVTVAVGPGAGLVPGPLGPGVVGPGVVGAGVVSARAAADSPALPRTPASPRPRTVVTAATSATVRRCVMPPGAADSCRPPGPTRS